MPTFARVSCCFALRASTRDAMAGQPEPATQRTPLVERPATMAGRSRASIELRDGPDRRRRERESERADESRDSRAPRAALYDFRVGVGTCAFARANTGTHKRKGGFSPPRIGRRLLICPLVSVSVND